MDHLFLPLNPTHPALDIPLISTEDYDYDGGDLFTYPERQGWGPRTIAEWFSIFKASPVPFKAFLERWFVFGVIATLFGKRIRTADFIRPGTESTNPMLSTKMLSELFQSFYEDLRRNQRGPAGTLKAMFLAKTHTALALHRAVEEEFSDPDILARRETLVQFIERRAFRDPRSPGMVMITTVVLETFVAVATNDRIFLGQGIGALGLSDSLSQTVSSTWTSFMWAKLRGDGWCPLELQMLFHRFNTSCLYFLHFMSRPGMDITHRMINIRKTPKLIQDTPNDGHSNAKLCTQFRCAHKQLNGDKYQTAHTSECTGCRDVVVDSDQLCEILRAGKIPVVLLTDEENESDTVFLLAGEPGMSYLAFSHVWSDGLGNLERNALPRCQMLRLSNLVRGLGGEYSDILLFWLDTLCVPPDAAGLDEEQQLAISSMRKTYEDAVTVLVLDSWLLSSACTQESHVETLLRILSSAWNTRLWTFQEGALAKALHFQFSDGAYDLDRGMEELMASADVMTTSAFVGPLKKRYHDIRGFRNLNVAKHDKVLAVAAALQGRSTSVASDEPTCLSVLLDLDVAEILRTDPNSRMQKFWRMLPAIPEVIAFSTFPSLDSDGLRWAPSTFLASPLTIDSYGNPGGAVASTGTSSPTTLTSRGLLLQGHGLLFSTATNIIGQNIYIRDENHVVWQLALGTSSAPGKIPYEYYNDGSVKRHGVSPWLSHGCRQAAFIRSMWADKVVGKPEGAPDGLDSGGLVVAVYEDRNGVVFGQKICLGFLQQMYRDRDRVSLMEINRIYAHGSASHDNIVLDRRNGSITLVDGIQKPINQRWCMR